MQLEHITNDLCPVCQAPTVRDEVETDHAGQIREHVHGGRWETRRFACGAVLGFVPNFRRVESLAACPKRPDRVEYEARRESARHAIRQCIRSLDVDDEFREQALSRVQYL